MFAGLTDSISLTLAEPIDAIRDYNDDKNRTYEENTYHHIAIVNYACYKIYPSVANKIISQVSQ